MTKPKKCSCCSARATTDAWGRPLCDSCFARWALEAPSSGEIESKAQPEQLAGEHRGDFISLRVTRPGLLERYYARWTDEWIRRQVSVAA